MIRIKGTQNDEILDRRPLTNVLQAEGVRHPEGMETILGVEGGGVSERSRATVQVMWEWRRRTLALS